jgi:hypothetical protein
MRVSKTTIAKFSRCSGPIRAARWACYVILPLLTLISGCSTSTPPAYDSLAVKTVCDAQDGETVRVNYRGKTKAVTVHKLSSWDELYTTCGDICGACVFLSSNDIYMVEDGQCLRYASHELGHIFDVKGMDAPAGGR